MSEKCNYEGCEEEATNLACGREEYSTYQSGKSTYEKGHPIPAMYCKKHAKLVEDENCPEYVVECPNCKCSFGVN